MPLRSTVLGPPPSVARVRLTGVWLVHNGTSSLHLAALMDDVKEAEYACAAGPNSGSRGGCSATPDPAGECVEVGRPPRRVSGGGSEQEADPDGRQAGWSLLPGPPDPHVL